MIVYELSEPLPGGGCMAAPFPVVLPAVKMELSTELDDADWLEVAAVAWVVADDWEAGAWLEQALKMSVNASRKTSNIFFILFPSYLKWSNNLSSPVQDSRDMFRMCLEGFGIVFINL